MAEPVLEPRKPRMGRLRAAWLVLMGQCVTPQQMVATWVEYQLIFNDLLERWSAKLARDAKAEKERIKRLDVVTSSPEVLQPVLQSPTKAELRHKVANMRGFGLMPDAPQSEVPNVTES